MNKKSPNKDKPSKIEFLSPEEIIESLEKRGLIINDKDKAIKKLQSLDYERLELYEHYFLEKNSDQFRKGTKFEHIVKAYEVDELLRMALFFALIKIENFLKTRMIEYFRKQENEKDAYVHENLKYFKTKEYYKYMIMVYLTAKKKYKHRYANQLVKKFFEENKSKATFPIKKLINYLTFGEFNQMYQAITETHQYKFVDFLKIPFLRKKTEFFNTWLHALSDNRNVCAHTELLFGRKIAFKLFKSEGSKYTESISNFLYVVNIIMTSEYFDQDFTSWWKNSFIEIIDKANAEFKKDLDYFDLYEIMNLNKDLFLKNINKFGI